MTDERWYVLVDGFDYGPFTEDLAVQFAADSNGLVPNQDKAA